MKFSYEGNITARRTVMFSQLSVKSVHGVGEGRVSLVPDPSLVPGLMSFLEGRVSLVLCSLGEG